MCRRLAYPCSHGIVDKCPAVGWLAPLTPTCWKIWCMCVCGMTRAAIDLGHALILVSMRNLNSNSLFLQLCLKVKGRSLGASLGAQMLKSLPTMQETWVRSLRQEDPLEKEMTTYSSILAWIIPWTEETGGLQSMGSHKVRLDWQLTLSFFFDSGFHEKLKIPIPCSSNFTSGIREEV